jgi:hypothetical protein
VLYPATLMLSVLALLSLLAPLTHTFPVATSTPALRALCCGGECSTPLPDGRLELRERPLPTQLPLPKSRWEPPIVWTPETKNSLSSECAQIQILRLYGILERLCNIMLSADDVALAEREVCKVGEVFMDARGNMTRSPVLLRQQTRYLMLECGMQPRILQRKWKLRRTTHMDTK